MIVTIDREFGSGGRELGKRLSDALGIPCYDDEIIEMVTNAFAAAGHAVRRGHDPRCDGRAGGDDERALFLRAEENARVTA